MNRSATPDAASTEGHTRQRAGRRVFLFATFILGALGCADADRASFLLVSVDTLRADHLGAYGFSADTSPNLDTFAAESVVFERALAASSRTAPSHASMMTSLWVSRHAIGPINGASRLPEHERTLAVLFQEAGWETAAFISNFVLNHRIGLDVGFELYDDELTQSEANRHWVKERNAYETTERAQQWLERDRTEPFFMWVHYNDPHGPYQPAPPHDAIELPPSDRSDEALPILDEQHGFKGIPAYQALEGLTKPSEYRSRYAGEIHAFDAAFAQLLRAAERAAAPNSLVVLLTADHGESLGEGGRYFAHGHGTTPELAHVPFILRAAGLPPGRRSELVHHVDVLPTLLELAGLPIPEEARGLALGSVIRAGTRLPSRLLFVDVGREVSAYQDDRLLRAHLGEASGNVAQGAWDGFRWLEGGRFVPEESPPELRPALEAYLRNRVSPLRADALDPEKRALLRALGYLAPE